MTTSLFDMALWVEVSQFARCKRCGSNEVAWLKGRNDRWYLAQAYERFGTIQADKCALHSKQCIPHRSESRHQYSYTPPPEPDVVADESLIKKLIDVGYRNLAAKYHPDHGGDGETMKQLNLAVEKLRKRYS